MEKPSPSGRINTASLAKTFARISSPEGSDQSLESKNQDSPDAVGCRVNRWPHAFPGSSWSIRPAPRGIKASAHRFHSARSEGADGASLLSTKRLSAEAHQVLHAPDPFDLSEPNGPSTGSADTLARSSQPGLGSRGRKHLAPRCAI
jgi:hypothetical protein